MNTVSFLLLLVSCVVAALVLFRQPHKLCDASKVYTRIIFVCCMFIFANTLLALIINAGWQQTSVLVTMFENLQIYLAVPLLCSLFVCISMNKHFSQAAWGRWSLVLLASFEICRRAEVIDIYTDFLNIVASLAILLSVLYKGPIKPDINMLVKLAAGTSFASAMLLLSPNSLTPELSNSALFNVTLAVSLCSLCYIFGKHLGAQSLTSK
jgi:hypothetical protein